MPPTAWPLLKRSLVAASERSVTEWVRNSLRNVLLDIGKCVSQRNLMNSDSFWRRFILAAIQSDKHEAQLWDFKETLTV
jgi:hypothetical protein